MAVIPTHIQHKATSFGSVPKQVLCEKCGLEFIYFISRSATAVASSYIILDIGAALEKAENLAQEIVRNELINGCDPVPCPSCGWVQSYMVPEARKRRFRWMWGAMAMALVILGGALLFFMVVRSYDKSQLGFWGYFSYYASVVLMILAAVCALVFPILKILFSFRYDPNAVPLEIRLKQGQTLAMSRDDYSKELEWPFLENNIEAKSKFETRTKKSKLETGGKDGFEDIPYAD